MTAAQTGRSPTTEHGGRWLTAAASLVVGRAFLALWF